MAYLNIKMILFCKCIQNRSRKASLICARLPSYHSDCSICNACNLIGIINSSIKFQSHIRAQQSRAGAYSRIIEWKPWFYHHAHLHINTRKAWAAKTTRPYYLHLHTPVLLKLHDLFQRAPPDVFSSLL